ncbi:MAG: transporter, partial [Gammaproteobacteria bacterium]
MKSSTSKKFAELVTNFPKIVLIFVFGLLVLSSFNLSNFKLDASSDSLVLETDDDLKYYREISEDYSSSDFLIVIFEPNEDLFSQKVISQVRSMVDSFTEIEGVESVLSYLDAPLLFSPKMPMTDLVDNLRTLEDEGIDLNLARAEFQSSPLYTELLTDSSANFTALQLILNPSIEYDKAINKRYELLETEGNELALEAVNTQIKLLNADASIKRDKLIANTREVMDGYQTFGNVYLGGTAMIASDMISFIKSDLQYFALGVLIMFIVTLGVIFKKIRWVIMPLASSGLVALFVIGFLGLMDWRVTVVSSNFISLLLIITISLTIHLIVRYQELCELNQGMSQK